MSVSSPGPRGVAVGEMSGGVVASGDINIVVQGIIALPTDYAGRIVNFIAEYIGTPNRPVPFGGRHESLARLDAWLDNPEEPPYALLAAPAGRGKSALLVRWTQRLIARQDLAVAFVPVSIRYRTNLGGVFFPAVTARLASLHGETLKAEPNTSVEVWRDMMADYLAKPLPDGRRLVVVLDGLDEAADWMAGPDLLPVNSPPGLRVLLSARFVAGDVDARSWLAAFGWEFSGLGKTIDLDRLSEAGVADVLIQMGCPLDMLGRREELVCELHRLSEGDPLLIRLYVDDLWKQGSAVTGLRLDDLRQLCPGLAGYFDRWWKEQYDLWGSQRPLREPSVQALLDLLACALGPLSRDDVEQVAPTESGLKTWTLDDSLRPLARFVIGDGKQQGYVFSHPRLASYFRDERLTTRERQRIEARFLTYGEETLAMLNEGRMPPAEASAYLVQYYAAHIERAGQGPDKLMALVSDGWRRAWEELERSSAGFLHDVDRAWQAAVKADETLINRGGQAVFLSTEVRCALCHASIHGLAGGIPPALLKAAVERGLWSASQGLAHVRQAPDLRQREEALGVLTPHLSVPQLEQALEVARALGSPAATSRALAVLAQYLPDSLRTLTLTEALIAARADADESAKSRSLALLMEHLPEPLRAETLTDALDAAFSVKFEPTRTYALAALARFLSEPLRTQTVNQALDETNAILDSDLPLRTWARMALIAHVPEPLQIQTLTQELEATRALMDESKKAKVLHALAQHLPLPLLSRTFELAGGIDDEHERSIALRGIAPYLPESLLRQALEAAIAIEDVSSRAAVLAQLAPRLPEPLRMQTLNQALDATCAIEVKELRSHPLEPLLERVTSSMDLLLVGAEIGTRHARNGINKSGAIAALAPHLPQELLGQALRAARDIEDDTYRSQALAGLAPHLPESLLGEALEIVRAIGSEYSRTDALKALAPRLPEPLLRQALDDARVLRDESDRALTLATLAPHLAEPLLGQALDAACDAREEYAKSEVLEALAPHLRQHMLGRAFVMADLLKAEVHKSHALVALIPHLSESLLSQAIEAACSFENGCNGAQVLGALARHLPKPLMTRPLTHALDAALRDAPEWAKPDVLAALAPFLPESLQAQALEAANGIESADGRARTLTALAPHLLEPLRTQTLTNALESVRAIDNEGDKSRRFATLAPHLLRPLQSQALDVAHAIADEFRRASALASLAPHLPEPLRTQSLTQAFEIAETASPTESEYAKGEVLKALAPHLPEPLLGRAFKAALEIDSEDDRSRVLEALAPWLPEPLLIDALQAARTLSDSSAKARVLTALTPNLPEPLRTQTLTQALETARAIRSELSRRLAMKALVPELNKGATHLYILWSQTLPVLASRKRSELLSDLRALMPLIIQLGGSRVSTDIFQAIQDVGRWWP